MTVKYERFKEALQKLCEEYEVELVSDGTIDVWDYNGAYLDDAHFSTKDETK